MGVASAILSLVSGARAGGEFSAGWEGDAGHGYSYCAPSWQVGSLAWSTVTLGASDLYYTYAAPSGEIRVQSPGVAVGPDLHLRHGVTSWRLGAAFEARNESQTSESGTTRAWHMGPLAVFDVYHGGDFLTTSLDASYGSASHYLWARAGALRALAPTNLAVVPGIGLELTAQGNADSQSFAGGVVAQVTPRALDSALQLRLEWSAPSLTTREWRPALHAGVTIYSEFGR